LIQTIADQLNIPTKDRPAVAPLQTLEAGSGAEPLDEPALAVEMEAGEMEEGNEEDGDEESQVEDEGLEEDA
jgi:hypothetical protein